MLLPANARTGIGWMGASSEQSHMFVVSINLDIAMDQFAPVLGLVLDKPVMETAVVKHPDLGMSDHA